MTEQLQLRRGTASQVAAFTGAQGEIVVDTTNNRMVVQDGATAGGFAAAKLVEPYLGVGTAADPSNVLSAYGASALFNGVNFNVTVNKSAAANTASFIFEDAFSGRAQIGLCGDDNFHFKVSANGSAWTTAIALDATTGAATFANQRTAVSDAAYSALVTDRLIAYTALTAARAVSLPAASAYPPGQTLTIVDEKGLCSAMLTITVNRTGADTINGATSAVLSTAYAYLALASNGSNAWTIVDQSTLGMAQQAASAVAITGGTINGTTLGGTTPAAGAFTNLSANGILGGKLVRANSTKSVASPTAPNSTSAYTMQGLAGSITPSSSGNVVINISGTISSSVTTVGKGINYQISYGAGAAPGTNGALAGTQVGVVQEYTNPATVTAADVNIPFSISWIVTSLTLATAYWIDLAAQAVGTASDISLTDVSVVAFEL